MAHTWEAEARGSGIKDSGGHTRPVSNNNSNNTAAFPLYLDPSSLVLQGSSFQPSACRTRSTVPEHLCITSDPTSDLSLTQTHSSADTSLLGPVRGWEEKTGLVFYNSIKKCSLDDVLRASLFFFKSQEARNNIIPFHTVWVLQIFQIYVSSEIQIITENILSTVCKLKLQVYPSLINRLGSRQHCGEGRDYIVPHCSLATVLAE